MPYSPFPSPTLYATGKRFTLSLTGSTRGSALYYVGYEPYYTENSLMPVGNVITDASFNLSWLGLFGFSATGYMSSTAGCVNQNTQYWPISWTIQYTSPAHPGTPLGKQQTGYIAVQTGVINYKTQDLSAAASISFTFSIDCLEVIVLNPPDMDQGASGNPSNPLFPPYGYSGALSIVPDGTYWTDCRIALTPDPLGGWSLSISNGAIGTDTPSNTNPNCPAPQPGGLSISESGTNVSTFPAVFPDPNAYIFNSLGFSASLSAASSYYNYQVIPPYSNQPIGDVIQGKANTAQIQVNYPVPNYSASCTLCGEGSCTFQSSSQGNSGTLSVSVSAPSGANSCHARWVTYSAGGSVTGDFLRKVMVPFAVYSQNAPYPGNVTVHTWQTVRDQTAPVSVSVPTTFSDDQPSYGGEFGCAAIQSFGEVFKNNNGPVLDSCSVTFPSVDKQSSVYAYLDATWLQNNCEDPDAWRCLARGPHWSAITLSPLNSRAIYPLAGASATQGWSSQNKATTVSPASQGVNIIVAKGSTQGSATYSIPYPSNTPHPEDWSSYRYLQIQIASTNQDNQPFTITFNGPTPITVNGQQVPKQWSFQTGAKGQVTPILVDLCAPQNATDDHDETQSKWPIPTQDGPYWGVTTVYGINFLNLAPNETYNIQSITLVKQYERKLTFLPTFKNSFYHGADGAQVYRHIVAETDGRQSYDMEYMVALSAGGLTLYSITDLVGSYDPVQNAGSGFNGNNSDWPCQSLSDYPSPSQTALYTWDGVHNTLVPVAMNPISSAAWLYAAGLGYWAQNWQSGIWVDAAGQITVIAQMLFDKVDFYPGCGDVFNTGLSSDGYTLVVPIATVLRGSVYGLVFGDEGVPMNQVTAELDLLLQNVGDNFPCLGATGTDPNGTPDIKKGSSTSDAKGLYPPTLPPGGNSDFGYVFNDGNNQLVYELNFTPPPTDSSDQPQTSSFLLPLHTICDRQVARWCAVLSQPLGLYPYNLHSDYMEYKKVDIDPKNYGVWYYRGILNNVPFLLKNEIDIPPSGGRDLYPVLFQDWNNVTYCLYVQQEQSGANAQYTALERRSYDCGVTWSQPVTAANGAKYIAAFVDDLGLIYRCFWINGTLQLLVQRLGMPYDFSKFFSYKIYKDAPDQPFALTRTDVPPQNFYLALSSGATGNCIVLQSTGFPSFKWQSLPALSHGIFVAGGVYPCLTVDKIYQTVVGLCIDQNHNLWGFLMPFPYLTTTIQPFILTDSGGTPLLSEFDSLKVSRAMHPPYHWMLTFRVKGEKKTSDWLSLDFRKWTRQH